MLLLTSAAPDARADIHSGPWGTSEMRPVTGDWDGNGTETVGQFAPSAAYWFLSNSNTIPSSQMITCGGCGYTAWWGTSSMLPIAGDWDGDGKDSVGLYNPSTAAWYLGNSVTAPGSTLIQPYPSAGYTAIWGTPSMLPFAGDWDGDGRDSIGLYNPSTAAWYLTNEVLNPAASLIPAYPGATHTAIWGTPAMKPVAGNWNGNSVGVNGKGLDGIALFAPSDRSWHISHSIVNPAASIVAYYGLSADTPLAGDWDGDGRRHIGVRRMATAEWFLNTAPQTAIISGPADGSTTGPVVTFSFQSPNESDATFECQLDDNPYAACTSPYTSVTLSEGIHTLRVRGKDTASNRDATPAQRTFNVSSPVLNASASGYDRVNLSWTAPVGTATVRIQRDGTLLTTRSGTIVEYRDTQLWYSTPYSYSVEFVNSGGSVVATAGPVVATTHALPSAGYPIPHSNTGSPFVQPVGSAPTIATTFPSGSAERAEYDTINAWIGAHLNSPNLTLRRWGVPVYESEPNDPMHTFLACTYNCSVVGSSFRIHSGAVPDPGGGTLGAIGQVCGTAPDTYDCGDEHLAVVASDGQSVLDLFHPGDGVDNWTRTRAGVTASMSGNGIIPHNYPNTVAGANAAKFSNLAGLVRPEELAQAKATDLEPGESVIKHALVMSVRGIGPGCPAWPATNNSTQVWPGEGISPMREGMRLRLKADAATNSSIAALPLWQRAIARAMQVYGVYVRDNGGSTAVYGESSAVNLGGRGYDGWHKAMASSAEPLNLPSGTPGNAQFGYGFPWNSLELIDYQKQTSGTARCSS